MTFWNDIIGLLRNPRTAPDPNEALRNSIFGNATATMPMPQYDDDLRRVQRRVYDMPQLETRRWTPPVPAATANGVFSMGSPGYYSGIDPRMSGSWPEDMGFYDEVLQHMQQLYQGGP